MPAFEELRHAIRSLRRSPSFTVTAIVALGIGVGANAAIFSLVDALLIRPLPLAHPDRVVEVWEDASRIGFPRDTPAPGNFADWKSRNHVFTDLAALRGEIFALTGDGAPEQIEGSPITANLLPLLGVSPILGRNITADEDRPGGGNAVLISHRLWQQRYGADPRVIGREILLDRAKYRIAGVMPAGFQFPDHTDVWTPLALSPAALSRRDNHYLRVFGRLRPGVTIADAQREMSAIAAQLAREHPDTNSNLGAAVVGLRDQLLGKFGLALRILAAGVACVLLICCVNVASLVLARAAGRNREWAVRSALGASRARLVRQGLGESVVIACAGALVGVLFASEVAPILEGLVPGALAGWIRPQLDARLIAFAFLLSLAAAAIFGSIPALAQGADLAATLQSGGRSIAGGRGRTRRALVITEVALTAVLSVAAGLMMQTVWRLSHVDLGFRPEGVLTLRTSLSSGLPYTNFPARSAFYRDVLARIQSAPGVISAGYTTFLPLTNRGGTSEIVIEGAPPLAPGQVNDVNHRSVSKDYFHAVGTPLLAGRYFADWDGPDAPPVVIVNEAMAKQFWPGQSPLGRRLRMDSKEHWATVVGVVASARQVGLDLGGRAEMYFACTQALGSEGFFTPRDLAIRVKGNPLDYAAGARQAIWSVDRDQPVADVQPLARLVDRELFEQRAEVWLLGTFAALALQLAALGLYGLLSHVVTQRMREIGIRMALGARRGQVLAGVLGEGLKLVAIGLAAGIMGAAVLTRVMQNLLYGVHPVDLRTFAGVAFLLLATGAAACFIPARRATRIDPMTALRME